MKTINPQTYFRWMAHRLIEESCIYYRTEAAKLR